VPYGIAIRSIGAWALEVQPVLQPQRPEVVFRQFAGQERRVWSRN
jgi:hypothetical protein